MEKMIRKDKRFDELFQELQEQVYDQLNGVNYMYHPAQVRYTAEHTYRLLRINALEMEVGTEIQEEITFVE